MYTVHVHGGVTPGKCRGSEEGGEGGRKSEFLSSQ